MVLTMGRGLTTEVDVRNRKMVDFYQEIAFEKKRHEKAWSKGYKLFPQVISKNKLKTGIEVGVAFGGHMEYILEHTNVEKLIGVDSYKYNEGYEDPMNFSQNKFDALYRMTKIRLQKYDPRAVLVRKSSADASLLMNSKIDFIYVDANHSFLGCLSDILLWLPKVKRGGIIGGHDYGSKSFPGVKKAVDLVFNYLDWEISVEGYGCWWVRKRRNVSYHLLEYLARCCLRHGSLATYIFKLLLFIKHRLGLNVKI